MMIYIGLMVENHNARWRRQPVGVCHSYTTQPSPDPLAQANILAEGALSVEAMGRGYA